MGGWCDWFICHMGQLLRQPVQFNGSITFLDGTVYLTNNDILKWLYSIIIITLFYFHLLVCFHH